MATKSQETMAQNDLARDAEIGVEEQGEANRKGGLHSNAINIQQR
jgi:hypothetical protein